MADIRTRLGDWTLDNPIIPASGTFGFGQEFAKLYDINILGSFSFKGTTKEPRFGNPTPRIAECTAGMINSVGLANPGIDKVIAGELPKLRGIFKKDGIGIIEVNISCPNVHAGGMAFGTSPEAAAEVTRAVKSVTHKPVYMKLSPNVTSIVDIAKACEAAGADGIALINTLLGMKIDIKRRKPVVANKMGGFSGPAIFPVAVRMVYQVYEAVKIPIIGMGGVASAEDVIEMMMAGASAVEIGAMNLTEPGICPKIIGELPGLCDSLGIENITDIIGAAHC